MSNYLRQRMLKVRSQAPRTHPVTPISTGATVHHLVAGAPKTACGREREQRFQIQPIRKWSGDWSEVTCMKCLKARGSA